MRKNVCVTIRIAWERTRYPAELSDLGCSTRVLPDKSACGSRFSLS
jgi:hypothetical protein